MSTHHRLAIVVTCLGLSVGCDQATKHLATQSLKATSGLSFFGDTFRLTYAENVGAFLSLGGGLPPVARFMLLTVFVGLMLLGILVYALASGKLSGVEVTGYALIAGGGISNWIDRLTTDGRVVDFMNVGIGSLRTGIFNVADLAIVVGIGVVLYVGWRKPRRPAEPLSAE